MVTDDSGAVVSAFNYDAYGAVRQSAGEARSFAYAGEQTDESALAFLRARSYDPTMGRFLQRDSLPVGNRYAYVAGNPLRYVDPSGHREVELSEIPNWIHDEDWDSINNETLRGNAKGYYFDDLEALTNDNPFDKLGFGLSFLAGGSLKVGTGGLAVLGSLRSGLARGPSALTECATAGLSSATGSITTTLASRALSGKQAQVVLNKQSGDELRDLVARALVEKGSFVKTEVNFKTPLGWRRADIAVYEDEGLTKVLYLVETKAGISRYLPLQRFKDAYLETVRGIPVTVVTAP